MAKKNFSAFSKAGLIGQVIPYLDSFQPSALETFLQTIENSGQLVLYCSAEFLAVLIDAKRQNKFIEAFFWLMRQMRLTIQELRKIFSMATLDESRFF